MIRRLFRLLAATLLWGSLSVPAAQGGINHWTRGTGDWGPASFQSLVFLPASPPIMVAADTGVFVSRDAGQSWRISPLPAASIADVTIVQDPSAPRTLYAIAGGALLRTVDGAESWTSLAGGLTAVGATTIGGLAVNPADSRALYVIASPPASNLVYRSLDSGASWEPILQNPNGASAAVGIAVDPTRAGTIYLATYLRGILKSEDGGDTWTPMNVGLVGRAPRRFALSPADPLTFYQADAYGLFRTRDGAQTWERIGPDPGGTLGLDPFDRDVLYSSAPSGTRKSTDGGASWNPVGSPVGGRFVNAFSFDPTRSGTLYASANPIMKSVDGGDTWTSLAAPVGAAIGGRTVRADSVRSNRVYAAAFGSGVFRSDDGGSTWTDRNSGPQIDAETRSVIRLLQSGDGAAVYAATPGSLLQTVDGGESWIRAATLDDGFSRRVTDVLVDPRSGSAIYQAALNCVVVECDRALVEKTLDAGASWSSISSDLPPDALSLFLSSDSRRLLAVGGSVLYRTDDTGRLVSVPDAPALATLAADPSAPQRLYGASNRLYRSDDAGETWRPIESSGFPPSVPKVLVVNPLTSSTIVVGTESLGVSISRDSGLTWTALDDGLEVLSIESLSFGADGDTLYAGTEVAVYQYTFCDACPRRVVEPRPAPRSVPARPSRGAEP